MNYIDLLIFAVIAYYLFQGYFQGFVHLSVELLSFIISLTLALLLNGPVGNLISDLFKISPVWSHPLGFFIVWFVVETAFFAGSHYLLSRIGSTFVGSKTDKYLSPIPAVFKGLLFSAIFLSLLISIPLSGAVKGSITDSFVGGRLIRVTSRVSGVFDNVFGGAVRQSLNFLTIDPHKTDETYDIGFKTNDLIVDQESEARMLELVNAERTKRGLKALTLDPTIVPVARMHSEDMFRRGYFSHTNPEGKGPCDRMDDGGVKYMVCGENLAYAPNVDVAHEGLMNSPGHRTNILSPDYTRIGIGVINAGRYGRMFTQNFAG